MKRARELERPAFDRAGCQANLRDLNGESLPDLSKLKFRHLSGLCGSLSTGMRAKSLEGFGKNRG